MEASSETIAGDRVADRQREEAEGGGEQDDVKHGMLRATNGECVQRTVLGEARLGLVASARNPGVPFRPDYVSPIAYEFEREAGVTL
jgi:hypothetical protein